MPKGLQNINLELLNHLKSRVAHSIEFSLNSNKNYDLLSDVIYERTGALLSNSTLRRVFQYDSDNHPTKSTIDLICKSIGYCDWEDFSEKEIIYLQPDLFQLIAMFKLLGLGNHEQTRQILGKFSEHPNFFNLLEAVFQIAVSNRDVEFLSKLFDLERVFEREYYSMPFIYFIHNLVITLNKSGLMLELVEYYGASPKAQRHIIEGYVDEDNLNGYFYQLLQVYHQHKTTPEAQLFYNCLMYQHAIENNLPTKPWLDSIRQFNETTPIHHIPSGRRFAILLLEANDSVETIADILNKTRNLFHDLNQDDKINTALFMVKLLFFKRKDELIDKVLFLAPDISVINKNIDDRTNINQIKIYRAYSLFKKGEKTSALLKLNEFDPFLVHAFIYNHIMNDYQVISKQLTN